MQPHVFVVMPFGTKEAQPALNVNFDEIYELLIKPSLIQAGCMAFRADKEEAAGDIRTDMYFELVTADAVVADISILNPNVFYELGVRHGVAPRGIFMIHGGWARRPFDVAPDRTFDYNGELFTLKQEQRDDAWKRRLESEVGKLGTVLKNALDADKATIGSPVYKELAGLKAADWSNIQTARAKYFGDVFVHLKSLVEIARENGWPGDILTLADDAPNRSLRGRLLWEAASALIKMQRFDAAKPILEELCSMEPENKNAEAQWGLVLGRLGKMAEARGHMTRVAEKYQGDTEAQGILGRVYKDLWRQEWKHLPTVQERQQQAIATSNYIAAAIQSYDQAARGKFDYYNGINVVSLLKLVDHLKDVTRDQPADCNVDSLDDLIAVVRFAAQNVLARERHTSGQEGVWAEATLGELELVSGNIEKARIFYRDAASRPDTNYFQVNSMLDQIYLFESLGFKPEGVAAVKQVLEQRSGVLEKRMGGLKKEPRFKRVFVCSGHMIDNAGRAEERFPPRKESAVRERIFQQLANWNLGEGDLAICGGARGADILFAELSADRGAEVWLFLPLPESEFLEASVRLPDSNWEDRFFAVRDRAPVKTNFQPERLKSPGKGVSVFGRNNLWMIHTARVEADAPKNLYAMLVWDEKPTGDGPGGTSDFADRIKRSGGRLAIINPTKL